MFAIGLAVGILFGGALGAMSMAIFKGGNQHDGPTDEGEDSEGL